MGGEVHIGTVDKNLKSLNGDSELLENVIGLFKHHLNTSDKDIVCVNKKFDASRETTITNFINAKTGVKSMQIEINSEIRDFYNDRNVEKSINLVDALIDILKSFSPTTQ